ncbi:MAG: hypothetical protein AAFY42_09595 [Pseudomonadota bacterium]
MKSVLLYTAIADNSGQRRDAGAKVEVGDGKSQITKPKAQELIRSLRAVDPSAKAKTPAAK